MFVEDDIRDDDMILDMENFDFMSIDDISDGSEEEAAEEEEEVEEPDEDAEESEESEESEEDEEEEGEEVEESEEDGETEEIDEVDYEGYEITLPNGENVVLAEVVQGYKDAAALKAEREEFESIKAEFESKSEDVGKYLALAKLEADKVIEDYEDFDWDTLSEEDPQRYTENRQFLDRYVRRHREIVKAMETIESQKAEEQARIREQEARDAAAILARDIPGWGSELYKKLMDYAVENGADPDYIKGCTDPATFKVLHKAMEFEKGKQKITAKVKRVGSPKKVAKAAPAKPKGTSKEAERAALLKKAEKTGDMSLMFSLLED